MKRLSGDALDVAATPAVAPGHGDEQIRANLEKGIDSQQGMQVIERILGRSQLPAPCVIVCPQNLAAVLAQSGGPDGAEADSDTAIKLERPALSTDYVAPQTEAEKTLASLWGQALGVEQVGTQDNFFELGGHSLLLTQIVSKARKQLAVDLPLSQLFDQPTIAHWGSLIDSLGDKPQAKTGGIKRVSRDAYRVGRTVNNK